MFILISLILILRNYCVETIEGSCQEKCSKFQKSFDGIFSEMPENYYFPPNEKYNIYIADIVNFKFSTHNLIICDPSLYLIYNYHVSRLTISENIIADDSHITSKVPILFKFDTKINLDIDTINDTQEFSPIILEAQYDNAILYPIFLTEHFPKNIIKISNNSKEISIYDKSEKIKSIFENIDKLVEIPKRYYCISDKNNNKCENYSMYNMTFISQTSEISDDPNIVIFVDTLKPLFYKSDYNQYVDIIGIPGCDFTYYQYDHYDGYSIIHSNSIDMKYGRFENGGNFTLIFSSLKLHSTTTKLNNINFSLKSSSPFSYYQSKVYKYKNEANIELENKINVHEFNVLAGDKSLAKLFEPDKFVNDEDLIKNDITVENLTDYPYYSYFEYRFKEGNHIIPKTWKKQSTFYGNEHTNFTFEDVYSYNLYINNFIHVSGYDRIIIKPSFYMYLREFIGMNLEDTFTIVVDHDFIMDGPPYDDKWHDRDEITPNKEKCKIIGNGTIKFLKEEFLSDVLYFCDIEPSVKYKVLSNDTDIKYNICVGKSNLEECKKEIRDINSTKDYEWIWLPNLATSSDIPNEKVYFTDTQIISYNIPNYIILTSNAHLIHMTNSYLYFNKNGSRNYIESESSTAKYTVIFSEGYSSQNQKSPFHMFIEEEPTEIDYQVYFYIEYAQMYTYYIENFVNHSINFRGKCTIFIREPYIPMINLFNVSDSIIFEINLDNDYNQLCYAEKAIDCYRLDDFVLPKNYSEFVTYESLGPNCDIYLCKNISFNINNYTYTHNNFIVRNSIELSFDLPNDPLISIYSYNIIIMADRTYSFDLQSRVYPIFDVKEKVAINAHWSRDNNRNIFSSFELKSLIPIVEIIPSLDIEIFDIYFSNNFTISSPLPQCFKELHGNVTVIQSKNWSYLYQSEEVKSFYKNYTAYSLDDYLDNDENLSENIVLAVESYKEISIPSNWTSYHNIYLLQEYQYFTNILDEKPSTYTYLIDGVILDNKTKIIAGNIEIFIPETITINANFVHDNDIEKLMYSVVLRSWNNNDNVNLYPGSLYIKNYLYSLKYIEITDLYRFNMLIINVINADDVHNLGFLLSVDFRYVQYHFLYSYICYYPSIDVSSKCPGNRFEATDTTSLLMAVKEYPNIPIYVGQNLLIPSGVDNHFKLYVNEDDILLSLPDSPYSILITENNMISFYYSETSLIDVYNKSIIDVSLRDSIELNIESNTNSILKFFLLSDVIITSESNFPANFTISVTYNGYKLYSYDVDKFKDVFEIPLAPYITVCAYDLNESFCSYETRELIENVFSYPFKYTEVEIILLSNKTIEIPSINSPINVNILSESSAILTVENVSNLELKYNYLSINNYWKFIGNMEILNIKLNHFSSLSIPDYVSYPVSLQLVDDQTEINLKSCQRHYESYITIHHNGNPNNTVTVVVGNKDSFTDFISNIIDHEGISFNMKFEHKYICICNDDTSCNNCENGINGYIEKVSNILFDPGENVSIRVFSNVEISSTVFTNDNDVYIDPNYKLNLTNVYDVYQNISNGIKVDHLHFENVSNLLIKPKGPNLNITMRRKNYGLHFSIELNKFLRLNAVNHDEKDINASRLYVSGEGELNLYDYPSNRIRADDGVKVIKGVYTICNSRGGDNVCSYHSDSDYKVLNNYDGFSNNFDPDSKIVVFVNTFSNDLNADISYLANQKVSFYRKKTSLGNLLDNEEQIKVRFYPTKELISNSDSTTGLTNSLNGALLDNFDSDLFIVGFNESLTIKQNGNISMTNNKPIVIQPMNEKVTIIVDDSVDIEKQKVQIETENEKQVFITVKTNKIINDDNALNNFFQKDPEKVSVTIENNKPSQSSKQKLPKGAIAGIVVGIIVIIIVVVVIVIIIVIIKKKSKTNDFSDDEDDSEDLGSIRI